MVFAYVFGIVFGISFAYVLGTIYMYFFLDKLLGLRYFAKVNQGLSDL